ncbi:Endoribonuclease L-PSP [Aspergillus ibericus CBS 121593]|uniref:Endoribonuclease L-PSP n=1 Tax=Aspergillus ibericus CBS 121593 TaxID=1448316 RepID=A0A395HA81_9EURO|nr:Endoribonuclease L-PSP [Aspergillus ibericus CBS 121593]RAL03124.1 Endoribonuclease L-PSP [Aspergillus ibericus CBS 121593]
MSARREAVNTQDAPPPRAFYNQAVVANGFVFCSGQLPKDATGRIVEGTIQDRANQCIRNLKAVLESAGSSLEKMVEVNVFLADMEDFEKMNETYLEWFGEIKPVRTCVAVKSIPEYTDIEMKCVALL